MKCTRMAWVLAFALSVSLASVSTLRAAPAHANAAMPADIEACRDKLGEIQIDCYMELIKDPKVKEQERQQQQLKLKRDQKLPVCAKECSRKEAICLRKGPGYMAWELDSPAYDAKVRTACRSDKTICMSACMS